MDSLPDPMRPLPDPGHPPCVPVVGGVPLLTVGALTDVREETVPALQLRSGWVGGEMKYGILTYTNIY